MNATFIAKSERLNERFSISVLISSYKMYEDEVMEVTTNFCNGLEKNKSSFHQANQHWIK